MCRTRRVSTDDLNLINGKDSMDVASCNQGARGVHGGNPNRKDALEKHGKMDPPLQATQARTSTKAAITEMQKHKLAGLANVGNLI